MLRGAAGDPARWDSSSAGSPLLDQLLAVKSGAAALPGRITIISDLLENKAIDVRPKTDVKALLDARPALAGAFAGAALAWIPLETNELGRLSADDRARIRTLGDDLVRHLVRN